MDSGCELRWVSGDDSRQQPHGGPVEGGGTRRRDCGLSPISNGAGRVGIENGPNPQVSALHGYTTRTQVLNPTPESPKLQSQSANPVVLQESKKVEMEPSEGFVASNSDAQQNNDGPEPDFPSEPSNETGGLSGKKRKVRTKRSIVWNHFDEIFDASGVVVSAKCKKCLKVYASSDCDSGNSAKVPINVLKAKFKKQKLESGSGRPNKSELELYLDEATLEDSEGLDVLKWWKVNSGRFPILSKMARDILAIPISSVASESAFSTGGRVLTDFRSSLTPKIVEALICTQDWLRNTNKSLCVEELQQEIEAHEKELPNVGIGSTLSNTNL